MIVLCLNLKLQANVQSPSTSFPLAVNPGPLHVFHVAPEVIRAKLWSSGDEMLSTVGKEKLYYYCYYFERKALKVV